jgi:hypothetical protein
MKFVDPGAIQATTDVKYCGPAKRDIGEQYTAAAQDILRSCSPRMQRQHCIKSGPSGVTGIFLGEPDGLSVASSLLKGRAKHLDWLYKTQRFGNRAVSSEGETNVDIDSMDVRRADRSRGKRNSARSGVVHLGLALQDVRATQAKACSGAHRKQ